MTETNKTPRKQNKSPLVVRNRCDDLYTYNLRILVITTIKMRIFRLLN